MSTAGYIIWATPVPQSGQATNAITAQDILSFIPISGDLARFFVSYMMLYKVVPPKIAKLVYNSNWFIVYR
jgi:hypothetical protein